MIDGADRELVIAAARAELQRREQSRKRLLEFTRFVKSDYRVGAPHRLIASKLDRVLKGEIRRLMILAPRRHGKLLADSTPMLTTEGWKTHGALCVGDEVFHPSGKAIRVTGISAPGVADIRVTLSDGSAIYCHENHEWTVYDRNEGRRGWYTYETKHFMRESIRGGQVKLRNGTRGVYQLPVRGPLEGRPVDLPLHPYALGAWLGDGSSTKPCITHSPYDTAVIGRITACGYKVSAVCQHRATGVLTTYFSGPRPNVRSAFSGALHSLGVYGRKHIPEVYHQARLADRLELLAGLIDTDGYVGADGRVRIVTADPQLASDIIRLVKSMGWNACDSVQEATTSSSGIVGRKPVHYIGFQPTFTVPTALPRKKITRLAKPQRLSILNVERVTEKEIGRCIQVDSDDGLYLAGHNLTPTHNSELGTRKFPPFFLGHNPGKQIITASANAGLARDFGKNVRDMIKDNPAYRVLFPNTAIDEDTRAQGRWDTTAGGIYVSSSIGASIIGRGADCLLIDDAFSSRAEAESAAARDAVWSWYTSVARPALMPGGVVVVINTRWHQDDLCGRLLKAEEDGTGEKWEVVSIEAICEHPETDPLNRALGEAAWPQAYPVPDLLAIKNLDEGEFEAQYQQNPVPKEGLLFQADNISVLPDRPADIVRWVRAWDIAATEAAARRDPDWTVGALVGRTPGGRYVVGDVVRLRGSPDKVQNLIAQTAAMDGRTVSIRLPQDPGAAGKSYAQVLIRMLAGYDVHATPVTGSKATRAAPLAAQVNSGNVSIVAGPWNAAFMNEIRSFPAGRHDDQVDAAADAFSAVAVTAPPARRARFNLIGR